MQMPQFPDWRFYPIGRVFPTHSRKCDPMRKLVGQCTTRVHSFRVRARRSFSVRGNAFFLFRRGIRNVF